MTESSRRLGHSLICWRWARVSAPILALLHLATMRVVEAHIPETLIKVIEVLSLGGHLALIVTARTRLVAGPVVTGDAGWIHFGEEPMSVVVYAVESCTGNVYRCS
jgi:hypothetical protein